MTKKERSLIIQTAYQFREQLFNLMSKPNVVDEFEYCLGAYDALHKIILSNICLICEWDEYKTAHNTGKVGEDCDTGR